MNLMIDAHAAGDKTLGKDFDNTGQPKHVSKKVLSNGITLITERSECGLAGFVMSFYVGSRFEPNDSDHHGICHYIEHLLFKETTTKSQEQVTATLDRLGGASNAETSKEYTSFYIKMVPQDIRTALDLVTDMIINPIFSEKTMENEKSVIIQEIATYKDDVASNAFDGTLHVAYGPGSMGRNILGTKETVANMTHERVEKFYSDNFVGTNCFCALCGEFDEKDVDELLIPLLEKMPPGSKAVYQSAPYLGGYYIKSRADMLQAHLVLGFKGITSFDSVEVVGIASLILGGGMSSRLFRQVRQRQGLVYHISSGLETFLDSGLFYIYAATTAQNMNEVLSICAREIMDMTNNISDEEFEIAKSKYRALLSLGNEGILKRAKRLAFTFQVFGRYRSDEEALANIESTTKKDVKDFIRSLIGSTISLSAAGLVEGIMTAQEYHALFQLQEALA